MSFSKQIFQKEIYDIEISDLQLFFSTPQEESSVLEFKSGEVEIDELYKEICAFLNTEGGILIVGAPQEKKIKVDNKEKKVCVGELTVSKIKEQDSLVRGIASNISPMPHNIKVKALEHLSGKVFILEIPQSFFPPHQASKEGKYYIRLERDSRAAPHGIVEALFYKRQKPNLNLGISIATRADASEIKKIEFIFRNESNVTAESLGFIINIGGVNRIMSNKNAHKEIAVNNGLLEYQDYTKDSMLVKGISMSVVFEVILSNSNIIAQCTYYCKDMPAEKRVVIIDTNQDNKFIKVFNSTQNDSDESEEDIYDYYNTLTNTNLLPQ